MSQFKEIDIKKFNPNPFDIKDKEWMLITAQKPDGTVNTMTASWGGFGIMWNKPVVFVVIRPQRFTKEFVDSADSFSLTFYEGKYKNALAYFGKVSGRNSDKIKEKEFNILLEDNIPYFEECKTAIFAKKLYSQPWDEQFFIEKGIINQWYPEKDFHILYVAEITKILKKENTFLEEIDNYIL